MIVKNKNPEVRFKGFSEDWEEKEFYLLFNGISNNTLSRDNLNYHFGNAKNIHYGDILVKYNEILDVQKNIIPYVTENKIVEKLKSTRLVDGDIIIADAAEDEIVGKCVEIINTNSDIIYPGLHTIAVRPKQKFAKMYLGYYMNSDAYHNQLGTIMQGTKVFSVSKSAIKSTIIRYPENKTEQKQIGSFFENIDSLISLHQSKYDKLVILKKAMLEKMFPRDGAVVPEIRFKGFTEDWEEKKLGNMGYTYTGLSGKTKDDFGHGEGKYVTYMGVFNNPVSNGTMTDLVEIDKTQNEVVFGDVFFTTSSETPDEVGMSSVWLSNEKDIYLNSFCFGYRLYDKIDIYYLSFLLRSPSFRKKMFFLAQGVSRYNISKRKVMEINIKIPNPQEQEKIGEYFKNLDTQISLHQVELVKLQNIKKGCFSKMFVS